MPTITVAPVVVRPETDSNTASVTDITEFSASRKGKAPLRPNTVQNSTTTRKPSRTRRSSKRLRTGAQITSPSTRVRTKPSVKPSRAPSSYHSEMSIGGSMVRLKTISNTPSIRWTT